MDRPAVIHVLNCPQRCRLPWWRCVNEHDSLVAAYDCPGIDDTPTPTPKAVAFVAAEHPGCDLAYVD